MRDELEAILEDEEALEAELASILSTRVVVYRKNNRQQSAEESSFGRPAGEERGSARSDVAAGLPVGGAQGMTVAAGFPAPESLYVGLAKARQAARYRRPTAGQRISLEKEPVGARAAGLDPAGLDQLFRRDARRYDGGFTWQ